MDRKGRAFMESDREGSEPVVIVNEAMAEALWPGEVALDRCFHVADRVAPCARIVGVAEDVHLTGLRAQPSLQYYIPLGQQSMFGGAKLVVRPRPGRTVVSAALVATVTGSDPRVWAVETAPLAGSMDRDIRPLRIGLVAFGISGALALIVAVLGLYSLMAVMVASRGYEIGVRVALGRTPAMLPG